MRFPAHLSAKLAAARLAGFFREPQPGALIQFLDTAEVLHSGSAHPVSHERIREILDSPAPIHWIGGSEPLEHPGIAHLIRAIAQSGRFVFLETRGALLRRRIHEFQPTPQLFLTVRIDGSPEAASGDTRNAGVFELVLEGIRAARLSGFFTAVRSGVGEDSDVSRLEGLSNPFSELDVDGWVITASTAGDCAVQKADEARKLIPNSQWRWFSGQLERELLSVSRTAEVHGASSNKKQTAQACEESVHLS